MNICMVGLGIGKTHGAFVGGHVNNVINLSRALAEKGFQVHIISTPPIHTDMGKQETSFEIQKGVIIHTVSTGHDNALYEISKKGRLSLGYGFKSFFKIVSAVKKLHKKEGFDVIHGHSGFPWVALIPEHFKVFNDIPAIHTLYCPLNNNLFYQTASKICFSKLDLVVAISNNVRNSLGNVIPEHKIKIIPPLIDLSRFTPNFKERTRSPCLLYIGNLSKTKGLYVLLEALKIVKKDFPNIKLLLGLDIPLYEFKSGNFEINKKLEALDITENVVPLGIIENLPKAMMKSDIFVAPFTSTYGPADYPLSVLEAMASGLPVIATNVGGIPEIIMHGETGLIVEPNNPMELAQAIKYLLENERKATKIGTKASEFVFELNKDAIIKFLSTYQELASD